MTCSESHQEFCVFRVFFFFMPGGNHSLTALKGHQYTVAQQQSCTLEMSWERSEAGDKNACVSQLRSSLTEKLSRWTVELRKHVTGSMWQQSMALIIYKQQRNEQA